MGTTNGSERPGGVGSVFVLGSLRWTRVLVPRADGRTYTKHEGWIAAPIVRDMVVESLIEPPEGVASNERDREWVGQARKAPEQLITPCGPDGDTAEVMRRELGGITAVFNRFPRRSDPKNTDKALRLDKNFIEGVAANPSSLGPLASYLGNSVKSVGKEVDVIAIYDDDECILEQMAPERGPLEGASLKGRHLIVACRSEVKAELIGRMASTVSGEFVSASLPAVALLEMHARGFLKGDKPSQ